MNIFRPIVAVLILFIPLYPKFPLLAISHTYVAIRLDDLVVTLSLVVYLAYQIKHHFPLFKQPISKYFIIYFLAVISSTITAILIYQTDPINLLLLHALRRLEYISLFYVTIAGIQKPKDLNFAYISLLLATFFVSVYGYGQKYFAWPVISTMNSEFSKGQLLQMNLWTRVSSTFAGHYDLAAFLAVTLIIIFCLTILNKNLLIRISGLIFWLFSFQILIFTSSRISIFAFCLGISLALILIKKYLWIIPLSLLVLVNLFSSKDLNQRLIATLPTIRRLSSPPTPTYLLPSPTPLPQPTIIVQTPATIASPLPTVIRHGPTEEYQAIDLDVGVARSGEIRFKAEWPRALTSFRKNQITGTGFGSITLATDNDYLRALGEGGMFGLISLLLIFAYFSYQTLLHRHCPLILIFFSAMISFLVNATFIDLLEASKTAYLFWMMMAIYYQTINFDHGR